VVGSREGRLTLPHNVVSQELVVRLQALLGFDNAALIQAMGYAGEAEFVCYRRAEET
jgi:hypothetical protein